MATKKAAPVKLDIACGQRKGAWNDDIKDQDPTGWTGVDIVDTDAVKISLDRCKEGEGAVGPLKDSRRQGGSDQQRRDIAPGAMGVGVVDFHHRSSCREARSGDLLGCQGPSFEAKAFDGPGDDVKAGAGVNEGTEEHVAGHP